MIGAIGTSIVWPITGLNVSQYDNVNYHGMMECGGMGICNRETGTCKCTPPFSGVTCNECMFIVDFIL